MAGVVGIEPTSVVLETIILPMNYTPKLLYYINLISPKSKDYGLSLI